MLEPMLETEREFIRERKPEAHLADIPGWRWEGTVGFFTRAKVPGGWLIFSGGVAFVPDPTHRWDGRSLP